MHHFRTKLFPGIFALTFCLSKLRGHICARQLSVLYWPAVNRMRVHQTGSWGFPLGTGFCWVWFSANVVPHTQKTWTDNKSRSAEAWEHRPPTFHTAAHTKIVWSCPSLIVWFGLFALTNRTITWWSPNISFCLNHLAAKDKMNFFVFKTNKHVNNVDRHVHKHLKDAVVPNSNTTCVMWSSRTSQEDADTVTASLQKKHHLLRNGS